MFPTPRYRMAVALNAAHVAVGVLCVLIGVAVQEPVVVRLGVAIACGSAFVLGYLLVPLTAHRHG